VRKNIIANLIGKFFGILSNFLFIPLYIHFLGFEKYSIISFSLVIAGIMVILDAGLTATLSREFARMDIPREEKQRIFKTLESVYLIVIFICISTVFLLSSVIAEQWLNLKEYNLDQASFFFKIISFDIGFQLLFRFYMGGLLGLENQVKANVYQVGWGMVRNGFVVIAIMFLPTLETFFLWQTLSTVIFAILIKLSLEKTLNGRYSLALSITIEKIVFKRVWGFAGGMLLIALVAALNTQMDKIAISKLLSLESLGYYTLAISLSQGILVLVNPIATAILPRFTAQYSANKQKEASSLFKKVSIYVAILIFSIMANLTFFGEKIVWIWTGDMKLAEHISEFIPIVAMAYAMLSLQVIPYYIAIANGYTKLNNLLGIISLIVTLPGYWLVTKYYGAIGAAAVFCGVQIFSTIVYLYFIDKKFIKSKTISSVYIKQIILPLVITLSIAFVFSLVHGFDEYGRIVGLVWIGISTLSTLIVGTLILVPIKELKGDLNFKSNNTLVNN
jgi:O-antigen/teichoic acid export membrane protein